MAVVNYLNINLLPFSMTNHFIRYMHVERLDPSNPEVEGLLDGTVYVQPKIDGTNTSVWYADGMLHFGKRSQEMGEGDDNRGVKEKYINDERFLDLLRLHPNWILYGEWLVPHTIKCYSATAWKVLYIFDITECDDEGNFVRWIPYEEYHPILEESLIAHVPVIATLTNPTMDELKNIATKVDYLIESDAVGEGIVIKRYDYVNNFGRTVWGKIVNSEFKIKSNSIAKGEDVGLEQKIVDEMLTPEFILKEIEKIKNEGNVPFDVLIPKAIGMIPYVFISEEIMTIIKKYKKPTIDFAKLYKFIQMRVKLQMGW